MFHIVLFQPQIPPNTGNIIRLCANTGSQLHLIKPLGFTLEDKQLKRAGLDYHEYATLQQHESFEIFLANVQPTRVIAIETCGKRSYTQVGYQADDALLFGKETTGLPLALLNTFPAENVVSIPMRPGNRSVNLSNSVAIVLFEAWRQLEFRII